MIETERLIIKNTSLEDVDLLLKMYKQVETQKYLGCIKNKTLHPTIGTKGIPSAVPPAIRHMAHFRCKHILDH